MSAERFVRLPDELKLQRHIDQLHTTDVFGIRMQHLIRNVEEAERSGEMSGYARWLRMYERGRRFVKLVHTYPGKDLPDFLEQPLGFWHRISERFYREGQYVLFDDFVSRIKNKRVILDKGSHRQIPTSSVMDYWIFNMSLKDRHSVRAILFEPAENIRIYKGSLHVLPDAIRAEFLRHMPGIQYVARIPEFGKNEPDAFWKMQNLRLSQSAKEVIEVVELGDPSTMAKITSWNHVDGKGSVRPNLQLMRRDGVGVAEYHYWRTGEWEKRTKGFDRFVELAQKHLLG